MSTGIILGLGLASIVIVFYMMLNLPIWFRNMEFNNNMKKVIKFLHDPNMVICIPVWTLFGYGAYVVVLELLN